MTVAWRSTSQDLPKCSREPDSHGVQVLIWPHYDSGDGVAVSPIAFYGRRVTDRPMFYLYGALLHPQPTHWAPLPDGPK